MARPKGVLNDKPWADALRLAVNRNTPEGKRRINELAEMTVKKALGGDMMAMREIADRIDGKAVQPVAADTRTEVIYRVELIDLTDQIDVTLQKTVDYDA